MKKYFLGAVCIFILSHSYSQSNSNNYDPNKGIQFYFGPGVAFNNFKNLNTALANNSLPSTGKVQLAGIAELDFRSKNLLFGLNSNMGAYEKNTDNYNSYLMNYGGGINIGYYVLNEKKFHLAPQAGIGFSSTEVKITQRKGFNDFNDVLANGNSIDIHQNVPVLDFALKFDFADFTKMKEGMFGLRAGYRYGLTSRGWGIDGTNNSTVDGSPKDRMNQFYFLATIGFAGQKPLHKMKM